MNTGKKTNGKFRIKQFLFGKNFPLIIISLFFALITISVKKTGDDLDFKVLANNSSLFDFLSSRYNSWSSRLLIESLLYFFTKHNIILWQICNIIVFSVLIFVLSYLFNPKKKVSVNWFLAGLLFLMPFFSSASSAGWIATIVNYHWPITAFFICMIPIKKTLSGQKTNQLLNLLYIPLAFFAANNEILSALLLIVAVVMFTFLLVKKKFNLYICILFCVALISIIFFLTCPGNASRKVSEIATWFPNFNELTFFTKILLSLTVFYNFVVFTGSWLFIAVSSIIALAVFKKHKKILYRAIAITPVAIAIILNLFASQHWSLSWHIFDTNASFNIQNLGLMSFKYYLPATFSFIITFGCMAVSLLLLFGKSVKSIAALTIFFIALASQLCMAFSPTIHASTTRPTIMTYFCLVAIGTFVFEFYTNNLKKTEQSKNQAFLPQFSEKETSNT